ncbi:hypothetical protein QJS04_geneDACA000536 [Acorus gramineus]|uniref:Uncharacterized protein n=1 Tax=Acorus gramineus TaxID=55184 RepID=A0AAV9ASB8_ACOGR|nr:hypothetical protein QJS04_geneDACA000536 [Acorus gramineus]
MESRPAAEPEKPLSPPPITAAVMNMASVHMGLLPEKTTVKMVEQYTELEAPEGLLVKSEDCNNLPKKYKQIKDIIDHLDEHIVSSKP